MISCNLLASFGASSATVTFHPLGVLSNGMTLPVFISYANARAGPKQTRVSLLCHWVDRHRRPSHLCLSRVNRHEFAFCILGHKQTSTLVLHNRLASRRVLYSTFLVQRHIFPRVAGCHAGTTVLHAAVPIPHVICLHRLSDLTPTACPTDSML